MDDDGSFEYDMEYERGGEEFIDDEQHSNRQDGIDDDNNEEEEDNVSISSDEEEDQPRRQRGGQYPVSRYKDVKLKQKDVKARIGTVIEQHWKEAQEEVEEVYLLFDEKFGTRKPTTVQLVELLLGKDSKIFDCFHEFYEWKHDTFKQFIATLALQCASNMSTEIFYKICNTDGLCDESLYRKLWRDIGDIDKQERGLDSFWRVLESSINESYRKLFVQSRSKKKRTKKKKRFVIDDYKLLFQAAKMGSICGIKIMQHVRANRKGPTMHQIVHSASNINLGIYWEKKDDTTKTSTGHLIAQQVAEMDGGSVDRMKNLGHISVHGDRAYTNPGIAEDLFVKSGMHVTGTKASTRDNPFVVDKKVTLPNDKRTEISSAGPKALFIKMAKIRDNNNDEHECYIHAYRNGTGNVIFVFTNEFKSFEWEFVPFQQTDLLWYDRLRDQAERNCDELDDEEQDKLDDERLAMREFIFKKGFTPVYGDPTTIVEVIKCISTRDLFIVSLQQRTADWFFLRRFSFTSRTAFNVMMALGTASVNKLRESIGDDDNDGEIHDDILDILENLRICLKITQSTDTNNNQSRGSSSNTTSNGDDVGDSGKLSLIK